MNDQHDEFKSLCRRLPAYKPEKSLWPGTYAAITGDKPGKRAGIAMAIAAISCGMALIALSLSGRSRPVRQADYHAAYYGSCGRDDNFGAAGRRGLPEYIQNGV